MLLLWKRGPLAADVEPVTRGTRPVVRLVCEFAAPPWPTRPLRKLTVSLITTYTGINTSYYAQKQKWQAQQQATNSGNFSWVAGSSLCLNGRCVLLFRRARRGGFTAARCRAPGAVGRGGRARGHTAADARGTVPSIDRPGAATPHAPPLLPPGPGGGGGWFSKH